MAINANMDNPARVQEGHLIVIKNHQVNLLMQEKYFYLMVHLGCLALRVRQRILLLSNGLIHESRLLDRDVNENSILFTSGNVCKLNLYVVS